MQIKPKVALNINLQGEEGVFVLGCCMDKNENKDNMCELSKVMAKMTRSMAVSQL